MYRLIITKLYIIVMEIRDKKICLLKPFIQLHF